MVWEYFMEGASFGLGIGLATTITYVIIATITLLYIRWSDKNEKR